MKILCIGDSNTYGYDGAVVLFLCTKDVLTINEVFEIKL